MDTAWATTLLQSLSRWEPAGLVELDNGARLIGHVPHVAELAYLHKIPAPLSEVQIAVLGQNLEMLLDRQLREFYSVANGLNAFSDAMSVYGLRQSYQRSDLLTASSEPYCVININRQRPKSLARSSLMVGGYSEDGSRVIIEELGSVFRCPRYDPLTQLNWWPSFRDWLTRETVRLGLLFNDAGKCCDEALLLPSAAPY